MIPSETVALRMKEKIQEVDLKLQGKDEEMQKIWTDGVISGFNDKYRAQTYDWFVDLPQYSHFLQIFFSIERPIDSEE